MAGTADQVRQAIAEHAGPDDSIALARYFKTGLGEYGAGDVFIGVRMPQLRTVVRHFRVAPRQLSLDEVDLLIDDAVHEHRMAGLLMLVDRYPDSPHAMAERYLAAVRRGRVNNWDLAGRLLADREDLIRKAVGWMLREVGKRVSRSELTGFLDVHAAVMPRTMLSYATEHLDPADRTRYRAMH